MTRIGQLGVANSEAANDIEDTKEALAADQKFKQQLEEGCSSKEAEWEEIKKTRAEELVALADTIKVLNDDDALDLFKQTLPSASSSLLQVQKSSMNQRAQAKAAIARAQMRAEASSRPRLDFILLALNGKKAGFGKVIKLVDDLVASLHTEQADD